MKTIITNALAYLAFAAFVFAMLEIPCMIHDRHCDGCNWFWCGNYNGK